MKIPQFTKGETAAVYDPRPFGKSENVYTGYCSAMCRNNKAGVTAVIMKGDNEPYKLSNRHVGQSELSIHRAEILAVIDAVNAVPDNSCLDIYVANLFCIDVLLFRHNKTSYQDLVSLFDEAVEHLADLRMHIAHSDTCKPLAAAEDYAEFSRIGIVKQKFPDVNQY